MTDDAATQRTAWVVRAGKDGEDEDTALDDSVAIIGFEAYADATGKREREEISKIVRAAEPDASEHQIGNFVSQFYAFTTQIVKGDIVVLPLKTRPGQFAIGRVTGGYEYLKVGGVDRHTRPVEWDKIDAQRTGLAPDLRRSLGTPKTVSAIRKEGAVRRLDEFLRTERDPGPTDDDTADATDSQIADQPVPEKARDDIRDFIDTEFTGQRHGHKFAQLINAILEAQGYVTYLSAPGPDGGVDILAGQGPLGFDQPRLCVQVKATAGATDAKVVREIQGTLKTFRASRCLVVSWGGFTGPARNEARSSYFNTRLWDADDVIEALQDAYPKLPEEIRAEIPLKRVWTLVRDNDL